MNNVYYNFIEKIIINKLYFIYMFIIISYN
uniref:Uncharacterized protein n=1 Tax=viral metagenome TaxID=1070528 RepID=A0A6C0H8R4_9ZZZZ